jgi:hypothetical protein
MAPAIAALRADRRTALEALVVRWAQENRAGVPAPERRKRTPWKDFPRAPGGAGGYGFFSAEVWTWRARDVLRAVLHPAPHSRGPCGGATPHPLSRG